MNQNERRKEEYETLILLLDELGFLLDEKYVEIINDKIQLNIDILPGDIKNMYIQWFLKPWSEDIFYYLKQEINYFIKKILI